MRSISEWLDYTQSLHSREIDLQLDRVIDVFNRLFPSGVDFNVISVAGTNGKGSCVAMLQSILLAQGYNVAQYTSPHLVRFNERFKINSQFVTDNELRKAYQAVEEHRKEVNLTFFEFATLVAIYLFAKAKVDVAVMEVGLGGRLDAVNILDADVAVISNIAFDHMAWLGDSLEEIAYEKVGIARQDKPCIIGMPTPPEAINQYCQQSNIPLYSVDTDFSFIATDEQSWTWKSKTKEIKDLPVPLNKRSYQLNNAATVLQALECLNNVLPINQSSYYAGLESAQLFGRCQLLQSDPYIVLDVAHNVDAVQQLKDYVQTLNVEGQVFAVCGMLQDKQIEQCYKMLESVVSEWFLASIDFQRGMSSEMLKQKISSTGNEKNAPKSIKCFDTAVDAYLNAKNGLNPDDCLLVFGSFHIVGDIIAHEKILLT